MNNNYWMIQPETSKSINAASKRPVHDPPKQLVFTPSITNKHTPTMSELRQRPVASNQRHERHTETPTQRRRGSSSASSASSKSERDNDQDPVISVLDLIRVALALVVATCGLSYYMTSGDSMLWGYRPWYTRWPVVVRWVVSNNSFLPPSPAKETKKK